MVLIKDTLLKQKQIKIIHGNAKAEYDTKLELNVITLEDIVEYEVNIELTNRLSFKFVDIAIGYYRQNSEVIIPSGQFKRLDLNMNY